MIRVQHSHWPVEAITHPGMSGKNNEDRFGVSAYQMPDKAATPVLLAVLSDGIGGHRGGEVAAELAVTEISQALAAAQSNGQEPLADLKFAIQQASERIYQQAGSSPALQGMGATVACAWIFGNRLYTATVGDSRIYLCRAGQILQLSTDHTWIQEAIERGLLRPEQARGHPNAHVIRRFLGGPTPPEVDFRLRLAADEDDALQLAHQGLVLQPGDRVLLCSDGLTDLVEADEMRAVLSRGTGLRAALEALVAMANERGGHDNITAVLIEAAALPRRRRSLWLGCLALLVVGALLLAVLGSWAFAGWRSQTPTPLASSSPAVVQTTAAPLPSVTPVLPPRPTP